MGNLLINRKSKPRANHKLNNRAPFGAFFLYMEPFDSIILNTRELKDNALNIVNVALVENKENIIDINRGKIYNKGIGVDGGKLKRKDKGYSVYSKPYEKIKREANLYQGHVDFNLSGEMLETMDLKIDGFMVYITAKKIENDWDLISLFKDYYGEYLGLSDNEWEVVAEKYLLPVIYDKILKIW